MGLAASQSRFLLLTARQNSLNSRMMSLQNQDMAIQRQSAILAQEYNKKQNAQKVTLNEQELNYAALMRPTTSGYSSMVTDSSGAVVLTNTMAGKLGLSSLKGDGSDFLRKVSTPNELMQKLGVATSVGNNTTTKYTGLNSAYKYDDNIMNQAIVKVQPSTILDMKGYLFDEEGNRTDEMIEYAMGTQQNSMVHKTGSNGQYESSGNSTSLACIYTLDKYAYTESNIHAVTNSFVDSATTSMSKVMIDELGFTDAVGKALEYATDMTKRFYANSKLYNSDEGWDKEVEEKRPIEPDTGLAAFLTENPITGMIQDDPNALAHYLLWKKEKETKYAEDMQQYYNAYGYNLVNIKDKVFEEGYGAADADGKTTSKAFNSTGIMVSSNPYINTKTVGVEVTNGTSTAYAKQVDMYEGHDVFINTAQLTATFLNYFDIGMMKSLGTETSNAFAEYLEGRMTATDDMMDLRNQIRQSGLSYYAGNDSTEPRVSLQNQEGYANYPVNDSDVVMWREEKGTCSLRANNKASLWISVAKDAGDFIVNVPVYSGSSTVSDSNEKVYRQVKFTRDTSKTEPDEHGNYAYTLQIVGATSQDYNLTARVDYLTNNGVSNEKVIGQYGNTKTLLSGTFDTAAAGTFGSKNLASDDYKSLVYGSSNSSGSSSAGTDVAGEYAISYYKGLFNAMAAGGWVVDGKVNDSAYLSEQILQGNICLQQFNNSKSWKVLQLGDSNNGLDTVKDQDTIDKAKAEYESKNAILNTNKTFIENQIKSLETQSQAMEKEQESLEGIMEKEQEKFKIFTSG